MNSYLYSMKRVPRVDMRESIDTDREPPPSSTGSRGQVVVLCALVLAVIVRVLWFRTVLCPARS